jgi:LysM repeat protein
MIRKIAPFVAVIITFGLCLAACNRPISGTKQSSATSVPPTPDELSMTRTAIAGPIIATLTAAEFTPVSQTQKTTIVPQVETPTTPVLPVVTVEVVTPVPATPAVKATATTQKPAVVKSEPVLPEVYWLHSGEFPFCIARRFNIDPGQLMCANGFCNGQVFHPGQGVIIPKHPLPFPGRRALHLHPATYRVCPGDSIYKIACFFGDLDPIYLAQFNGLTSPYQLRAGQILNIP